MTGQTTDVFCAAGLTLPDKAGRQLTAGGWAGVSNFGVSIILEDNISSQAGCGAIVDGSDYRETTKVSQRVIKCLTAGYWNASMQILFQLLTSIIGSFIYA
jgi:hypothetical protein